MESGCGNHFEESLRKAEKRPNLWPYHWRVVGEGVQIPHVAVDQTSDVLDLSAEVLVGGVSTQHADPAKAKDDNALPVSLGDNDNPHFISLSIQRLHIKKWA